MEQKRERRRRDLARMKAKAHRLGWMRPTRWRGAVERNQGYDRLYDHLAECSGPCCGNPRRWYGEVTMQERRFEAALAE